MGLANSTIRTPTAAVTAATAGPVGATATTVAIATTAVTGTSIHHMSSRRQFYTPWRGEPKIDVVEVDTTVAFPPEEEAVTTTTTTSTTSNRSMMIPLCHAAALQMELAPQVALVILAFNDGMTYHQGLDDCLPNDTVVLGGYGNDDSNHA